MAFEPPLGQLFDAASGLLIFGLGLFVGLRRPRNPTRTAFGWFGVLFGPSFTIFNAKFMPGLAGAATLPFQIASGVLFGSAGLALLVFASRLHRRAGSGLRAIGLAPWSVFAAILLAHIATMFNKAYADGVAMRLTLSPLGSLINIGTGAVLWAGVWSALHVLATTYGRSQDLHQRREIALISSALALYPIVFLGEEMVQAAGDWYGAPIASATQLAPLMAAWLWLWARWLSLGQRPDAREAPRVATLLLAGAAFGAAAQVLGPWYASVGVARTAGVVIMAYALIRHQALGIDLRIKWTIKQSTLAAIFIAVFFVASELAAQLLSEQMGPILGIIAAGALLFAIVPLQHLAQRVADKAMPNTKATGEMTDDERLDIYRDQVQRAWADGNLSRDERELLSGLRDKLGIDRVDASRIEDEAAADR